jgi:hypothetical protein
MIHLNIYKDITMKQINIFELQNSVSKKKELRKRVFITILNKCHAKIKEAAKNELYLCYYEVPRYVIGLPLYNLEDCIKFIINQLVDNGFVVEKVLNSCIVISWFPKYTLENKTEELDIENNNDLLLKYIPYKDSSGKFVLNVD